MTINNLTYLKQNPMNTVFGSSQERGSKDLVTTLVTTFAVFIISVATFAVALLSESSSAKSGASHVVVVSTQGTTAPATHSADTTGLMSFPSSNLSGALK